MKFVKPFMLYKMVKNLHPPKPGRLLGLDVGHKLVGLAVSDLQYKLATPYSVLEKSSNDPRQMAQELQKLIADLSLTGLVIGHPFKNGRLVPSATPHVFDLVDGLSETEMLKDVHFALWDDSYTTLLAKRMYYPFTLEPEIEEIIVPQFAAVGVLQGFLDGMMRYEKYLEEEKSYIFPK